MNSAVHVYNEIGSLKSVLLHYPGYEVENIVPDYLRRLLFDDIAYLKQAQKEHTAFAALLAEEGVEVLYLTELMADILSNEEIKEKFLLEFMQEAKVPTEVQKTVLLEYFKTMTPLKIVEKCIAGVRKKEIGELPSKSLADIVRNPYPFYLDPIPNAYFQRDPFASIGKGISLNVMSEHTRNRETLFAKYLFQYHPRFQGVPKWYDRDREYSIEGGDILILSDKVMAIGISQRTDPAAIEAVARNIFASEEPFEVVLAFDIPKARAYMHLDTVFTMVDYDQFTIYPGIESPLDVYSLTKVTHKEIKISYETEKLSAILKRYLHLPAVNLIPCGNGDYIAAGREQWSDGSNTLAIAPGKVICYDRNYVTNEALRKHHINVLEFPSYELSRGRGGPRCMSMPILREKLT